MTLYHILPMVERKGKYTHVENLQKRKKKKKKKITCICVT